MSPTEQATEAAIAKMDDAPVDNPQDDKGAQDANPQDDAPPTPPQEEAPAEDKPAEDKPSEEPAADEEGYTADQIEEEPKDEPAEDDAQPIQTSALSPTQQYVYDNLPSLSVRGKAGTDGEVKTFTVKVAQELPDNFEFASDRDRAIFNQDIADQTTRANQLTAQYTADQQKQTLTEFEARENADIQKDMSDLQREGLLPKFKLQPNDPGFEDSPEVKQAQEVLSLMNERNQKYAQEGRLARISYRDAFDIWQGQQASKPNPELQKEDSARKQVTEKIGGSQGASPDQVSKPRVSRGSTIEQILELHERDFE